MQRTVFVLSPPKTATQSVFFSLRDGNPGLSVFHAHDLDNTGVMLRNGPPAGGDEGQWRFKVGKDYQLLRALLDARRMKTIISVRRAPADRVWSHLFYTFHKLIGPHYDPVRDSFNMEELHRRLDGRTAQLLSDAEGYAARVYEPLGIPAALAGRAYGVTHLRDDMEFVALRFEALAHDFARLTKHLGLPETNLLHMNPARDRSQDAVRDPHAPSEAERAVYRAFLRDYPPSFFDVQRQVA